MSTSDGGFTCPNCGMWVYNQQVHDCVAPWPPNFTPPQLPYVLPQPIGCICPPGANKECERMDCPRKGIKITAAAIEKERDA